jgi:hypothetical protein
MWKGALKDAGLQGVIALVAKEVPDEWFECETGYGTRRKKSFTDGREKISHRPYGVGEAYVRRVDEVF